jgi:nickel transport system ATP-binding protein
LKQRLIIEDLRLFTLKQNQPQELVRGISLEIQQGKVVALVGGSGCGKSLTCAGLQGILPAGVSRTGGGHLSMMVFGNGK